MTGENRPVPKSAFKRGAVVTGVVVLLGGGLGLGLALRRQPGAETLLDSTCPFRIEASGSGQLITFQDDQLPLRALHWVGPLPGGLLVAQVLTQSDRQQVVLFRGGQAMPSVLVSKPAGVSDGFWRLAVLKDVLASADGALVLLYSGADPGSGAVVVGLDSGSEVRWTHRGAFQQMVLSQGSAPALFLFGPATPIQRLALAAAATSQGGRGGLNGAARTVELPPEIKEVEALLSTGGDHFLVSHRNGLSAYAGSKGWTHFPAPEDQGVACVGWRSNLIRAGRKIWWQAVPGKLEQVGPDGTPMGEWVPQAWAADERFAQDGRLLRLLGADASGALWLTLAVPAPSTPLPVPAPIPQDGEEAAPALAPALEDWPSYAAKGLDRVYRWDQGKQRLERFSWGQDWAALHPPPQLALPGPGQGLRPESGGLLVEAGRSVWWLPLGALPFQAVRTQTQAR